MVIEILSDGCFELLSGAEAASANLLLGEGGEEAFDLIEPARRGRREVDMVARMTDQPALDGRRFMGGVVVHHQMHVQVRRHVGFDGVEELAELDGPMAALELADDLAGFGIERGEQAGGAVTEIVMSSAFGLSGMVRLSFLAIALRLSFALP